jgi:hypothetical protein
MGKQHFQLFLKRCFPASPIGRTGKVVPGVSRLTETALMTLFLGVKIAQ